MRGARSVQASDTKAFELPCGVPEVCRAGVGGCECGWVGVVWGVHRITRVQLDGPWTLPGRLCSPPAPAPSVHRRTACHTACALLGLPPWCTWASCQAEYFSACLTKLQSDWAGPKLTGTNTAERGQPGEANCQEGGRCRQALVPRGCRRASWAALLGSPVTRNHAQGRTFPFCFYWAHQSHRARWRCRHKSTQRRAAP